MKLPFELLHPAGLWLLGAMVPLVVLYILKIKRQRLPLSSIWLWQQAQRDLLAQSPFKRLVPQVPLFLQLLTLLFLSLALSGPSTRARAVIGDHLAIIIDTSASMSSLDASGKSRLELAKDAAWSLVDALSPTTDALVLEAGADARVACPLDHDRRRLQEAIEQLSPTDAQGELGSAVALATDRLRQLGGSRRLLVFTDGALTDPQALTQLSLPLEVVKVGSPIDNAGIIRLDIRSGTTAGSSTEQVQVFAMLANFGARPRDLYVTLRETNASDVLASRRMMLQPGERTPVVLTFQPSPGDIGQGLIVDLSPHDAFATDDIAYGRVPPGSKITVALAASSSAASPWVERALKSDPLVEVRPISAGELASGSAGNEPLVVVEGVCPPAVATADLLIINPPEGQCLGASVGPLTDAPPITSWAVGDNRFRFLTFDDVHVAKARLVKVDSPKSELVHSREGTLIADVSPPGRTATLVSFDVGESNWPLKASFVLFIRNIVETARAHRVNGITHAARAGEPMRLVVPPSADKVQVVGPDKKESTIAARNGLAVVPNTTRAGVYQAFWKGPQAASLSFAVNLTSEKESDVKERPLDLAQGALLTSAQKLTEAHTDWTWLCALLALGLVVADVWFLTRKPKRTLLAPGKGARLPERRPA